MKRTISNLQGRIFLLYTIVFAGISALVFYPFYSRGLTLIWEADGATQYMIWLRYAGVRLKGILSGILRGHPAIPLYDFTIGWGDDIRQIVKTDPFLLAGSLFVNRSDIGPLYSALTLLRIYASGVSFSIFCRHKRIPDRAALPGSLIYAFSGYSLYYVLRHPQFAMGPVWLPLLLTGVSLCYEDHPGKGKRAFLPIVTALSLFSGYYFHYMNTIAAGVYALLLFAGEKDRKKGVRSLLRTAGSSLLGCGLAAFSFLPSFTLYLTSGRNSLNASSILSGLASRSAVTSRLFSFKQLSLLPATIISPANTAAGPASVFCCVLIIPAMVSLWTDKCQEDEKGHRRILRISLVLVLAGLCIPAVTSLFTGFGSDYQRWSYIAVFVFSLTVSSRLDKMKEMTKAGMIGMIVIALAYLGMAVLIYYDENVFLISFSFLLPVTVIVILSSLFPSFRNAAGLLFWIVGLTSILWGAGHYNKNQTAGFHSAFLTSAEASGYYDRSPFQAVPENIDESNDEGNDASNDASFFRSDMPDLSTYELNGGIALNKRGLTQYSSTINRNVLTVLKDLENSGLISLNLIRGIDHNRPLSQFLGVKYLVSGDMEDSGHPLGFDKDSEDHKTADYTLWKNEFPVSIGASYSHAVKEKDYRALTPPDRAWTLLSRAVIPPEMEKEEALSSDSLTSESPEPAASPLPLKVTSTDELIQRKGNRYVVDSFDYDDPYFEEDNLEDPDKISGIHFSTRVPGAGELCIRLKGLSVKHQEATDILLATDISQKTILFENEKDYYYPGLKNMTVSMGSYDGPQNVKGVLSFTVDDTYTLDEIEAYFIPADLARKQLEDFAGRRLEDVRVSADKVVCSLKKGSGPYVIFSIPYRKGWNGQVDGRKCCLYRCGGGFTGLILPERIKSDTDHVITLSYTPPGLIPGLILSLVCLLALVIGIIKDTHNP